MVLLTFSIQDQVEKYGAYVAIAAFFGLAVLSLLYFAQAREVKRLREWAGRAPELGAEMQEALEEVRRAAVIRQQAPAPQRTVLPEPVAVPAANGVTKLKPEEVAALAFARSAGVREPHEPTPHPVPAAAVAAPTATAVASTPAATNGTGSGPVVPPTTPAARRLDQDPPPLPPRRTVQTGRRNVPPTPPPRRESSSRAVVLTAVIGVIVLAVAAFVVTQLGGNDKPTASTGNNATPTATSTPGKSGSKATPTPTAAPPTKDKALVFVFNGSGVLHLAAKYQQLLVNDGYTAANLAVGTTPEAQQVSNSVVMYSRGNKTVAQGVARTLGIDSPVALLDAQTQALLAQQPKKNWDAVVILGQDKSS